MSGSRDTIKKYVDLGEIVYRKNKRAQNISIRVRPFKGIIVTVPRFCTLTQAERFVHTKRQWLTQTLRKIKQIEDNQRVFDDGVIRTRTHLVNIQAGDSPKPVMKVEGNTVTILYPEKVSIDDISVQTDIRSFMIEIYRKEAKSYLPGRLDQLAAESGFHFQKVFIKNLKSRWGSCSGKNNINLNLHLMRLPDHLIDYILMHELTHTKIKNHSREFWQLLEKKCPGARRKDKELKYHHIAF